MNRYGPRQKVNGTVIGPIRRLERSSGFAEDLPQVMVDRENRA